VENRRISSSATAAQIFVINRRISAKISHPIVLLIIFPSVTREKGKERERERRRGKIHVGKIIGKKENTSVAIYV